MAYNLEWILKPSSHKDGAKDGTFGTNDTNILKCFATKEGQAIITRQQ